MCKFAQMGMIFAFAGVAAAGYFVGRTSTAQVDRSAAFASFQPGDKKQPPAKDAPPPMPPGVALEPAHEHLKLMLGTWEGSVKFKMGDEWVESKGKAVRELAMDGRFIIERVEAEAMGTPFKGMGIVGYNTLDKKFESVWIENMATYMSTADGTFDAKTKTFTFMGDMIDPMTGKKCKQRTVMDCSNPTKETMKGYAVGADGKEEVNFTGEFTKK